MMRLVLAALAVMALQPAAKDRKRLAPAKATWALSREQTTSMWCRAGSRVTKPAGSKG